MRRVLGLILPFLIPFTAMGQVVLNEIYVFGQNHRTTQERFIELRNVGTSTENIAGYSICLSNPYGEEWCDFVQNNSWNATMIKPSKRKIIKINRTQHPDQLLYMNLRCEEATMASLYHQNGKLIDQIEFKDLRNKRSIQRVESEPHLWIYAKPTRKNRNQKTNRASKTITYAMDSVGQKSLPTTARDTSLLGLVKINEAFFVSKPDGFINKDFWVELINVSDEVVDLSSLGLTTDPKAAAASIKEVDPKVNAFLLRPNHLVGVSIDENYSSKKTPLTTYVADSSSTIYLLQNGQVIDSLEVPPLARGESFGRYPDGRSQTRVLIRQTIGNTNRQIFPGVYATPSWVLLHGIGVNVSDYNTVSRPHDSKYRPGVAGSLGAQIQLRNVMTRHYVGLKRQSFRIEADSVISTNFGRGVRQVRGFQRMSYLSFKTEIGYPLVPKLNLFLGMELDVLTQQVAQRQITNRVEIIGEEPTSSSTRDSEFQILSDPIDLNIHLAIEYQIVPQVFFNLSYQQDFISVSARGANDRISTSNIRFQFVVPIHQSNRLKEKFYLFYP